jgi:serine/threonine protein kinase
MADASQSNDATDPDALVEEVVRRFEQCWQIGQAPSISDFLPTIPQSEAVRNQLLIELVAVDLEFRWKAKSNDASRTTILANLPCTPPPTATGPLLEHYALLFESMGTRAEFPAELVLEEYRVRHKFGDRPHHEEFITRFGGSISELETELSLLDRQLERERKDSRKARIRVDPKIAFESAGQVSNLSDSLNQHVGTQEAGRYTIQRILGEGAMGAVYLAHDTMLDRAVALKIPKHTKTDREQERRFFTEARSAATLRHPNICPVYDVGEIAGQHYIAMAFIEGRPLSELIEKHELFDESKHVEIFEKLAGALHEAHLRGIVHRDLKPANVMIDPQNEPVIMDFGLAHRQSTTESRLTQQGSLLGTPAYMSPEQVEGRVAEIGPASDIYSLGVIFYQVFGGQLPFDGPIFQVLNDVLTKDTPELHLIKPGINLQLSAICSRMMARRIADRFTSMRELAQTLAAFRNNQNISITFSPRDSKFGQFDSLAVLPLENATGDPGLEYLSDGVTETLINTLSRFDQLRVMARSTVFRFKNKDIEPQQIGRELQVKTVLTGRIKQQPGSLVFATELINVRDGSQIWGDQYKRQLSNVLDLEEEIAHRIAKSLRLKLRQQPKKLKNKKLSVNASAYQQYLKGRFHWNKRTAADLKKAIGYFQQAIAEDPNYALAYAGLADSYGLMIAWGASKPHVTCPLARDMASKALELDDTLADAYTSL